METELRTVITDFKTALRFVKPLSKIVQHLEFVDSLERREKTLQQTVFHLEEKKQNLEASISDAGDRLAKKQQNVRIEIKKINEDVQREKESIVKGYDEKINRQKDSLVISEQRKKDLIQEIESLDLDKKKYTKEIIRLRDAINTTNTAVNLVEGDGL